MGEKTELDKLRELERKFIVNENENKEHLYGIVNTGFGKVRIKNKKLLKVARMFLDIVEEKMKEIEKLEEAE
jgi:hypothetical protein